MEVENWLVNWLDFGVGKWLGGLLKWVKKPLVDGIETLSKWSKNMLIRFVKLGPIPTHVAFIMDGNRRYAKKRAQGSSEGHKSGFNQLESTLEWCMALGIHTVTVYAFSIDNFKRPESEVNALMDLANEKFRVFASQTDLIRKHGIRIRVLGALHLLPRQVQEAAKMASESTAHYSNATLNICMAYTSREEMSRTLFEISRGLQDGLLSPSDVSSSLFDLSLYTKDSPPIDILVRTSGEARLSDFLLHQVSKSTQLFFLETLWPDFTFYHMLPILLSYQSSTLKQSLQNVYTNSDITQSRPGSRSTDSAVAFEDEPNINKFLSRLDQ